MATNSTTPSQLILPAETVKVLNITHRSIQLGVSIILLALFSIVCIGNKTHLMFSCSGKRRPMMKMSTQVSLLLNACWIFTICRIVVEVLRIAAFANPKGLSSPLYGVSHIGVVIIYPGNNTILALLIESWAQIVTLFVQHPKTLIWTSRIASIIANLIAYVGWMIPSMFLGWRPGTWQKKLGFNLTSWVGNPAYTLSQIIMCIEITAIGILVLTILKRIRQKVDLVVFSKVTICIIIAWFMLLVRIGMTIALGMKLISILGEWVVFIVHTADLTVLFALGILFFPLREIMVVCGLSSPDQKDEENVVETPQDKKQPSDEEEDEKKVDESEVDKETVVEDC